jgi:hypothetical protein
MNSLDKTMLTSSEDELKAIYEEELEKLHRNEFILECFKKLCIENFSHDCDKSARKNIESTLLAARINDFLDIGGGHTLLGELVI